MTAKPDAVGGDMYEALVQRLRAQRDHADDWRTTLCEEAADALEQAAAALREAGVAVDALRAVRNLAADDHAGKTLILMTVDQALAVIDYAARQQT